MHNNKTKNGMTLIETLIAVSFFVTVSIALYNGFTYILRLSTLLHEREAATFLANEQLEIIRNMPYQNIGTTTGIPHGTIPATQILARNGTIFTVTTTIRSIDDPFDGTIGGTPNDLSPADNKLAEIAISCTACRNFGTVSYTTKVAPKNLETASTNGALILRAFDSNGQPVSGATVTIVNDSITPVVSITDTTTTDGTLSIVDAPPSVEGYKITVTKNGYSTEQTYPTGASGNPNPTKPNATVVVGQITQLSFTIDQTSTLQTTTITTTCSPVPSLNFSLTGSKTIGTNPTVLKYDVTHTTNGSGANTVTGLEWDTYVTALLDASYDLIGTNPLMSLGLPPGATQNMQLIVAQKSARRLLVVVRDQSTGLPISDASVTLQKSGYTSTQTTNEGFISQSDWSLGDGQADYTDPAKYFSATSGIDTTTSPGEVRLENVFGAYTGSGALTSSTFNTGAISNFHQIVWSPTSQPSHTGTDSVRMQIATNTDNTTWNYLGPDGTDATYYTLADQNINAIHDGDQYLRYRLFLSTEDSGYTPSVSDVSFTFSSSCTPPGQISFAGLASGTYTITVTKDGYQTYTGSVSVNSNWQKEEITLTP